MKRMILLAGLLFIGCAHIKSKTVQLNTGDSGRLIVLPVPKHEKKTAKHHKSKVPIIVGHAPKGPLNTIPTSNSTPNEDKKPSKLFNILLAFLILLTAFLVLNYAPVKKKKRRK